MKALVLEASPVMQELIVEVLVKEGFVVDATDSAKVGLNFISQNRYQLITSNAWSNDGSGLEMIKKIRERSVVDPVLIFSARCRWQDIIAGYLAGADDYVSMPVGPYDVKESVQRLMLGKNKPNENEIFKAREQMLKYQKISTEGRLVGASNEDWLPMNEEGEWLVQEKKRQARKEQLIRAQSFVYPEIY